MGEVNFIRLNAVCACTLQRLNSGSFWTSEEGVTSISVSKKRMNFTFMYSIIKLWAVYLSYMTAPYVILLFAVSTEVEKDS